MKTSKYDRKLRIVKRNDKYVVQHRQLFIWRDALKLDEDTALFDTVENAEKGALMYFQKDIPIKYLY